MSKFLPDGNHRYSWKIISFTKRINNYKGSNWVLFNKIRYVHKEWKFMYLSLLKLFFQTTKSMFVKAGMIGRNFELLVKFIISRWMELDNMFNVDGFVYLAISLAILFASAFWGARINARCLCLLGNGCLASFSFSKHITSFRVCSQAASSSLGDFRERRFLRSCGFVGDNGTCKIFRM